MIGEHIRRLRKARNLSINELAARANISKSYLSSIERDIQQNPSIEILAKIAQELDVDIQVLLGKGMPNSEKQPLDGIYDNLNEIILKVIEADLNKEQLAEVYNFIDYKKWAKMNKK